MTKRKFFESQKTKPYTFRIIQLQKLKNIIKKYENEILNALYKDLRKPKFEAFTQEIGIVYNEIDYAIKNLNKWIRPVRKTSPLFLQPSASKIYSEPYGVVLIISPWNYPFQLTIAPLIGAIAAGNCAVIVPSNDSANTSNIIAKIISETYKNCYISVIQGEGKDIVPQIMNATRFDYVFFTGSPSVGRKIYRMASDQLIPVTLELGGKSPVIVDKDVDMDNAAKKIVWGKFINAGQVCVAPDYLLVHESIKDNFVNLLIYYIEKFFGQKPIKSKNYGRIINKKRFKALEKILNENEILYGGQKNIDDLFISPTLIDNGRIIHEEIFGPILPILTFKTKEEASEIIKLNKNPLALYVFTKNKSFENYFLKLSFGGGCVNDCIFHLASSKVPFGGIGKSGIGMYHGKYSFETFSHKKTILSPTLNIDLPFRYPPYSELNFNIIKKFF